ncbi:hypothetical protein ON010_g14866 [Phytophthora cinnamomi]|nr:hypothetical protein ON010_g14866 [Phytophthora cinnamomi]
MSTPAVSAQPQLYIYDHCPFCCRARVAFGLKKVPHDMLFLANHDEATPIGLVGSKQAPILVPVGGKPFAESWDIVAYIDAHYGGAPVLQPASGRQDLAQWVDAAMPLLVKLYLPRFHAASAARFHAARVARLLQAQDRVSVGAFSDNLAQSAELVKQVNALFVQLGAAAALGLVGQRRR